MSGINYPEVAIMSEQCERIIDSVPGECIAERSGAIA
jgi:hypothetical protein